MRNVPKTRFPLPDLPYPTPAFPADLPFAEPISQLCAWWLEITCTCKRGRVLYPLRLLSAEVGWTVTLERATARLRCPECGQRPSGVSLVEHAAGGPGSYGSAPGGRLEFRGREAALKRS